ncbi:MAG TPA: prepilin-type N-terminal cleavage/methylation domain-containing protein [Phycisphaerales bacterium]|nr:prepilin-type N-terminal cleavage/methylation domain-containing protein [Phycisphaerales bacterium]
MPTPRAFTLTELTATLAVLAAGACLTAVCVGQQPEDEPKKPSPKVSGDPEVIKAEKQKKAKEDQIKDSTHVRGIHQGLVMFAQNNKDKFPLPSVIDKGDHTVKAGQATEKDTTANIMSMLVFNGFFGPELCVSPAESNDKIKADEDYEYASPRRAVKPEAALWDPAFSADFSDGNTGNFSYAHLMPSKSRLEQWGNTFKATEPAIGNRGPKVVAVTYQGEADKLRAVPEVNGKSKTYAIHGPADSWEGNIAFNDNHVEYMSEMTHPKRTFKDAKEIARPDVLFFNEDNDPSDSNTILGIFTHAGPSTKNFKAIWD